jgi:citrate lyase subunit beta/citryl-CoA lyase
MRSVLFAPGNRPDLTAKLARPGADAVVLDLEDGTPPAEKESARRAVAEGAAVLAAAAGPPRIFVRTNASQSRYFDGDLAAVVGAGVPALEGVVVPKVESAAQITRLERRLTDLERRAGSVPHTLIVGIETAAGVEYAHAILAASTRACAVYFGAEDFATDVGALRTAAGPEVAFARARVVIAARLAGVAAVDQAVLEVREPDRFRADAERGREFGYGGKLCVHPGQVALAHEVFSPGEQEVEHSRRLIAAYDRSLAEGEATLEFEGQMVDGPVVERARRLLEAMPS